MTLEATETISIDCSDTGAPTLAYTGIVDWPGWANRCTAYLNVATCDGTTNTVDLAYSYVDPRDRSTVAAFPGSGITQVVAAGLVVVAFDPIAADDDVAPIYTLHAPPGIPLYYSLTLGSKSVNEVQTLTLSAGAAADTFKLTFNAHESSEAVTIPAADFHDVTAAQIKACLLTISDFASSSADIAVVKSTDDYIITFSGALGNADLGAITVTSKTGTANGSVAETTKGVTGDEVYDVTLTHVFSKA